MSNLELIKEKQDVVYNILNNSLKSNTLAHAYLFSGIKGSLQIETAYLLFQSLVCENSIWACEKCDSCLRIKNNNYPDFIILDGSSSTIKKSDVLALQQQFSMTSLESSSYKLFLIKDAHKMTISAANSLLKFLEEPSSSVVGILISDEIESLLPTIISRCTTLNFKRLAYNDNYLLAKSLKIDDLDAYFYSKGISNYLNINEYLDNLAYILFKEVFNNFIDKFDQSPDQALYIIHQKLLSESDKEVRDLALKMFIDMMLVFFKDINNIIEIDDWYTRSLIRYHKNTNYLQLLEVMLQIKNQHNNNVNSALLMDQMMYRFKEVI